LANCKTGKDSHVLFNCWKENQKIFSPAFNWQLIFYNNEWLLYVLHSVL